MLDNQLAGKGDPTQSEVIFLLDEIESHLHPAWQRKILPAFQKLFPKAQLFVATHSPFLISSLNHGWIHCLTLKEDGSAALQPPVAASQGDSYISVVEQIMGVKELFDTETEKLLADFRVERDQAIAGNEQALMRTRDLASKISSRGIELSYMMGKELAQLEKKSGV